MKTTDRFHLQRRQQLEQIFNESDLKTIWRKIVKKQLRSLEILDLHDYYDFNYRIEDRVKNISKKSYWGGISRNRPLFTRLKRSWGFVAI